MCISLPFGDEYTHIYPFVILFFLYFTTLIYSLRHGSLSPRPIDLSPSYSG